MKNDDDRCGIGRCRQDSALTAWGVPICWNHHIQCNQESESSLPWLRRRARKEWQSFLPSDKELTHVKPKRSLRRRNPGLKANPRTA